MKKINQYFPHLIAILGFILVALLYFYPVLLHKKLYQSDIVQYSGMAKAQQDYRTATGEELYWTDSAFLGMPTYQLGAKYPYNYVKRSIRLFDFYRDRQIISFCTSSLFMCCYLPLE